jgi:glycosyltransferase involved in cell wall biosynthesis
MHEWRQKLLREHSGQPRPLRVLVASHSHPEVSNGGAEIAAFQLYKGLAARDDCEAWFLGCDRNAGADKPGALLSQPFSANEYLYATGTFDWFKFANRDPRFRGEIERLFSGLAPDIVHFHHYINFGVEVFAHLKRVAPACKIVLTLHEYLAICNHYGQMVTKGHRNLCYEATPQRCQNCFPEFGKSDFFLRKLYIERFFGLVDMFVAPSQFLADRYIAWGIPAEKMAVLENLMPPSAPVPAAMLPADGMLRLGFFGQISSLKGIDVIFDAATLLAKDHIDSVSFEIFGDYRGQPPEFQAAFLARLEKAGANIRFNGPYDRPRVNRLMQSVHAILVPSVWWENSPVVIQEALRNKRPVICSDIGGMAEKVRDGIDGFHFAAGNPIALAILIRQLAENRALLADLTASLSGMPEHATSIEDYLGLYHGLGAGTAEAEAELPAAPEPQAIPVSSNRPERRRAARLKDKA